MNWPSKERSYCFSSFLSQHRNTYLDILQSGHFTMDIGWNHSSCFCRIESCLGCLSRLCGSRLSILFVCRKLLNRLFGDNDALNLFCRFRRFRLLGLIFRCVLSRVTHLCFLLDSICDELLDACLLTDISLLDILHFLIRQSRVGYESLD